MNVGMKSGARSRAGNNVGVESGEKAVVYVEFPVLLRIPVFLAMEMFQHGLTRRDRGRSSDYQHRKGCIRAGRDGL